MCDVAGRPEGPTSVEEVRDGALNAHRVVRTALTAIACRRRRNPVGHVLLQDDAVSRGRA
jgi:hypothetical protein